MIRSLLLLATLSLVDEKSGGGPEAVTLVRDGRPSCSIVTADNPTPSARQAASALQMWLRRAGGAPAPILSESQTREESDHAVILVGDTRRPGALGIDPNKLDREEIRLLSARGVLIVVGDDARPDGLPL